MKRYIILLLALVFTVSSCKKDKDAEDDKKEDPSTLYIRFDLDGVAQEFKGTRVNLNTGKGSSTYTSSGFLNFGEFIDISLNMYVPEITGDDLKGLIGKKISTPECIGSGCGTSATLEISYFEEDYSSHFEYNPFPEHYIKFNTVEYYKTVVMFGDTANQYLVTGEFNLKLGNGTVIKSATNGKFKLLFQDVLK